MNTNEKIEKLSICTNLGVIDKINELINNLNVSDTIEVPADAQSSSDDYCLIQGMSNFTCKLTIVTEDNSILVFLVTNTSEKKEIRPIFVEAKTDEFSGSQTSTKLLLITDNSDLILHYNKKCKILIDGIDGEYDALYPDTELSMSTAVSSTGPTDWNMYVPRDIVKAEGSWITVRSTYNNDGKAYQIIIGFDESEVRALITEVDERLSALIQGILDVIGERDDVKSEGIPSVSFEGLEDYDVSAMNAVRVSLGETTYSFGTTGNIYYCDGYFYIGDDNINLEIFNAAYNSLIQLPDYVNSYMISPYGQKTFYKVKWDKTELETLISQLNSQYQLNIRLNEMEDESELPRNRIDESDPSQTIEPIIIELQTEECDTIWANINDLYNRDEATNERISNIDIEINNIDQSITNINNSIQTLTTNVATNTTNITNLTNRVDEIYRDGQTPGSHEGLLQNEIDRNDDQDGRLDELLKKTEDSTTHVITETGRVVDVEQRLDGVDIDLAALKKFKPYIINMDLNKEYTCIAEVEYNVSENGIYPFTVQYDVVTKNKDELSFVVSNDKIQLLNLTNNSYDFNNDSSDKELVITEFDSNENIVRIYLKKYDSQKTEVSIAISNNIKCKLNECPESSLNYSEFSNSAIKLTYDTDFFRNIDPIFTTTNNSGIVISESMEPINPSNSNAANNPKSRNVNFDLDTGEVEFNNQQFDVVLDGQTDKTTVSIKNSILNNELVFDGTVTGTRNACGIGVSKNGISVDPRQIIQLADTNNIVIKITSTSISELTGAIFKVAAKRSQAVEFIYNNNFNGMYRVKAYLRGNQPVYGLIYKPERTYINRDITKTLKHSQGTDPNGYVVSGLMDGCFNEIELTGLNSSNYDTCFLEIENPNPIDFNHTNCYDILFNCHDNSSNVPGVIKVTISNINEILVPDYKLDVTPDRVRIGTYTTTNPIGDIRYNAPGTGGSWSDSGRSAATVRGAGGTSDVHIGIRELGNYGYYDTRFNEISDAYVDDSGKDVGTLLSSYWARYGGPLLVRDITTSFVEDLTRNTLYVYPSRSHETMISVRGSCAELKIY